jgi:hypothetical protein
MSYSLTDTLLGICLGVGLSAACGFRVFVPLLVLSAASLTGHLTLAPGFAWVGSYPALITFSVATGLEIAGYYIPWVDHFLDSIATPAAVLAGTLVTASLITDVNPLIKWSLALIAGGGIAGIVQGTTVLARGASLMGTGGLANPVVATAELGAALLTSLLAILLPFFVATAVFILLLVLGVKLWRRRTRAQTSSGSPSTAT